MSASAATDGATDAGRRRWANGGVVIALVSSCLAHAAAITRYLPATPSDHAGVLRWAIGFCCVPAALLLRALAQRRDWRGGRIGLLLLRRILRALQHRDVLHHGGARHLALATLPLHTMLSALFSASSRDDAQVVGVGIAVLGVAAALATGSRPRHRVPGAAN